MNEPTESTELQSKRCTRHDLALGADGRCVVCLRELRDAGEAARVRRADRTPRLIAKILIGVMAGLAAFFLLMALLDTNQAVEEPTAPLDATSLPG